MKKLAMILLLASSCAPRAIGYQNHPSAPAYYPRQAVLHIGPIVVLNLQKP